MIRLHSLLVGTLLILPLHATAGPVSNQLLCADRNTWMIRESTVFEGCLRFERSLGATAITSPQRVVADIHPKLKARFQAARAAAKSEGITLYIASGFRTLERQKYLFDQAIKKYGSETEAARWVLPPDVSHHPLGLAIDVNYPKDRKGAKWLEKHGSRFGLCRTFDNEWWHFEAPIAPGGQCPPRMKDARDLLPAK